MTKSNLSRRLSLTLLYTPLLLLAGCPADTPTTTAGAPGKTSAKQTAPTVPQTTPTPAGAKSSTTASAPSAQQSSAQPPDQNGPKAQQLINKAESSYNSGIANYRASRLDAARLDFDFAIDTMLASGMDLKSEGPLADEFNRLLDAINSLEMAALKQGNGLSPKLEAAPLDTAEDITFAPNPELVAKLKTELSIQSDLPLVINDQVAGYIGVFSQSESFRRHMAASLQRVGKYRGLIQSVLKEENVPQDLIYLAVAESGFQPQVVNGRSGAGGMWQFMVRDGAEYGLSRNGNYDYRFDPEKATRAYAKYIKKLYGMFGDWYLAMAAYDWGPGSMQHAVQRTGYADYWELYRRNAMPAETRAYVPQILAAIIMAKNPERYGLDKLTPSPAVIYDTVAVDYAIDVRLVADVTEVPVGEVVALNPALLRLTTPRDISFDLHIPPGTKQLFAERLKDIPKDRRASWRFHIVKPGETLEAIATSLHARLSDIAETNDITAQDPMSVGDELVVPVEMVAAARNSQRYTARRGDTLITVADRFNISTDELRRWNKISASTLKPGRVLYVAEPVRLAPSSRARGRRASRRGASTHAKSAARRTASHASNRSSSHAASAVGHAKVAHGKRKAAH